MSNKNYDVNFSTPRDFVDPWAKVQESTSDFGNIFGEIDKRIKDDNKSILDRNDRLAREKEAREYQAKKDKILKDQWQQNYDENVRQGKAAADYRKAEQAARMKRDAIQNATANFKLNAMKTTQDKANAAEAVNPFLIGLQSIYGDQTKKIEQNKKDRTSEISDTLSFLNNQLDSSKPSVSSLDDLSDKDKLLYKSGWNKQQLKDLDYKSKLNNYIDQINKLNSEKLSIQNNFDKLNGGNRITKSSSDDSFSRFSGGNRSSGKNSSSNDLKTTLLDIDKNIFNIKSKMQNLKKPMTEEDYSAQFFKDRVGKQTPSQIEDSKIYSDALKSYKDWTKSKEGKSYLAGGTLHDINAEEANNWINSNYKRIVAEKNITDPLQLKALRTGLVNEYNRQLGVSQQAKINTKKRMQDREDKMFDLSNKIAALKVKFENSKELQNIKDKTKLKTAILELMKGDPNYKDIIENAKLMNKVYKAFDVLN